VEAELAVIRSYLEPTHEYAAMHRQFVNRWAHELGLDIAQPLAREASRKTVLVTEEKERATAASFKVHSARQQDYSVEEAGDRATFYAGAKRLEWIEIENFKAITRLRLAFPEPQTAQEPWLMLLGENGTGKSSILQAVALALMGERHANELDLDASTFVRRDASRGSGKVRVKLRNVPEPVTLRFRRSSRRFHCDTPDPKVLLLGYGATRLLRRPQAFTADAAGYIRVKNLFDPTAPLDDVETWLLDRDQVDDDRFETIGAAMKDLLMLGDPSRFVRNEHGVEAVFPGSPPMPLRQLSDGFQSVVALCADVMKILLEWWPSMEDAEGVVLLDELEAHLHPTWKIEIVERLRRTFPSVAFIVSTHEPLCLKGLEAGEICVLRREAGRPIEAITDVPPVNDLRADQILTSPLFGLHSTRGDQAVAAMDRYAELLGKRRRSESEEEELEQLEGRLERTTSATESPRGRQLEETLWRAVVEHGDDEVAAAAAAAGPRRRRPTDEEKQLRRELAQLLGPGSTA
jgi:predicted ATPase